MLAVEIMRLECPLSAWTGAAGRCQWCDSAITDTRRSTWCSSRCQRQWDREHLWRHARAWAKRKAKYRCVRDGCEAERLDCEVNHLTAREGRGYGPGCHHHQMPDTDGVGGLEVLCHAHHAEVTAQQARDRAARRLSAFP